jgi:hypothetical protein
MNIHYSPPHVVHAAYARSCAGIRDMETIWTKVAANVYVIERRFDHEMMERLSSVVVTHNYRGSIRNVDLMTLYKPVYFGELLRSMPGWQDYVGKEKAPEGVKPVSWWLNMEFVEPGERIRFPALPAKINMTEWIHQGELRELYSYDGFGFTLRDSAWGRE